MKVSGSTPAGFKPFSITFTFETREDAQRMHALFNHPVITNFIGKGEEVRRVINRAGEGHYDDPHVYGELRDSIDLYS